MKKLLTTTILLAASLVISTSAVAGPPLKPEQVLAPIHRSFIPQGFDNNDNSQIIVTGGYPNSCYQVGHTQYRVDQTTKRIDIEVTAYRKQSDYCLQVYVPFQQEISVGVLDKGDYTVSVNQESRTTRTLSVRDAPSINPDNHIYAPVTQVIRVGPREFLLRGTFHSNCLNIADVKVNYEAGEVLSVLPMAHYDGSCFETGQARPWEARFQVRADLNGEFLLHIRSLNGDALNTVQAFSPFDF